MDDKRDHEEQRPGVAERIAREVINGLGLTEALVADIDRYIDLPNRDEIFRRARNKVARLRSGLTGAVCFSNGTTGTPAGEVLQAHSISVYGLSARKALQELATAAIAARVFDTLKTRV